MVIVILPDGSRREFDDAATAYDVAAGISGGLARAAIVAEVDGELRDLHAPLVASEAALEGGGEVRAKPQAAEAGGASAGGGTREVRVRLITKKDAEALGVMRHSAAH